MGCLGSNNVGENKNVANEDTGNKLLIIVSPSGGGKDDIMKSTEKSHKGKFSKAVSHTTRAKQEGEKEGVDYYFITVDEFNKMESNGEFVETSENNGDKYGLSKKELESKRNLKKIVYANLDVTGAEAIKRLNIPANFVSILPSDENTISNRIKEKYDNMNKSLKDKSNKVKQKGEDAKKKLEDKTKQTSEEMKQKIDKAKQDMKSIKDNSLFNLQVISNDLKKAATDFDSQLKACYPEELNN